MPTYVISTQIIHDPETYRKYTNLTPPIVQRHGGRFLTRGDEVVTVEGETFIERQVILEFPSKAKALEWFNDPEYQAASQYRRAASKGRITIQEGRDNTNNPDPKV